MNYCSRWKYAQFAFFNEILTKELTPIFSLFRLWRVISNERDNLPLQTKVFPTLWCLVIIAGRKTRFNHSIVKFLRSQSTKFAKKNIEKTFFIRVIIFCDGSKLFVRMDKLLLFEDQKFSYVGSKFFQHVRNIWLLDSRPKSASDRQMYAELFFGEIKLRFY